MALLDTSTKFNITNIKKETPFVEDKFFAWTNNNMYRTSYHDMSAKVILLIDVKYTNRHLVREKTQLFLGTKDIFHERVLRIS